MMEIYNHRNRVVGWITALLCLFFSTNVLAAEKAVTFKVPNADGFKITYQVKDAELGWVSVTNAQVKKKAVLRIPETVDFGGQTYTVVEIADRAFGTNKDHGLPFSEVELPNTIQRIGKFAFQWCDRLEKINFPDGLLIIDGYAFAYTYKLKELYIPSSVVYIGDMAFQNWKPLYFNYPKECQLDTLPAIVTPNNCRQYGLSEQSVAQYYATHTASAVMADVSSDSIQRLITAWNSASDAKWAKRMKRAQIVAGVMGGLVGAAAVAVPAFSGGNGTSTVKTTTASTASSNSSVLATSTRTSADGGNSGTTTSSQEAKKRVACRECVNGRRLVETSICVPTFGMKKNMKKCSECGNSYDSNEYSHRHERCTYCNGKGYKEY